MRRVEKQVEVRAFGSPVLRLRSRWPGGVHDRGGTFLDRVL